MQSTLQHSLCVSYMYKDFEVIVDRYFYPVLSKIPQLSMAFGDVSRVCCLAKSSTLIPFPDHYRRMDRASAALSEGLDPMKPRTYAALSKYSKASRTTLWNRAHGRPSIEEKATSQQYLTTSEEKSLVEYLLRMSEAWRRDHWVAPQYPGPTRQAPVKPAKWGQNVWGRPWLAFCNGSYWEVRETMEPCADGQEHSQ
jgi:hypothetical protein